MVYPCHAVIVSLNVSSNWQRFFIGHTDKVNELAGTDSFLACMLAQPILKFSFYILLKFVKKVKRTVHIYKHFCKFVSHFFNHEFSLAIPADVVTNPIKIATLLF